MDRLDIAYNDFSADIKRIKHLVELVSSLKKLGGSDVPEGGGAASWGEAYELWEKAKDRRTDLPLVAGSLLMYLAGRFEYFVRQLVEISAEEMASTVNEFRKLPDNFQSCLKSQVLEVLQNPWRYGYDNLRAEGCLKDFSALLEGRYDPNKVSVELLSLTDSNIKQRVLADISKRIGIENLWKDLGKQSHLKIALEKGTDSETTKEAQTRLDALMTERNGLAHPTSDMTFPDPEKVFETANFVTDLGKALKDLFRVYLVQWSMQARA